MKVISKSACLFLAFTGSLFAQHLDFGFDFGVKGGVPFTDVLRGTGTINGFPAGLSQSSSYLIGPVAEVRFPFGFAFEADGIYHSAEYSAQSNGSSTSFNANAWEIPYLAKFRFPIPLLKPFVSAGGAYRTFTDLPNNVTPTHNAFVVAAGLELRIKRLRISGEARWLRWGDSTNTAVRLVQNQGEVLFGVVF